MRANVKLAPNTVQDSYVWRVYCETPAQPENIYPFGKVYKTVRTRPKKGIWGGGDESILLTLHHGVLYFLPHFAHSTQHTHQTQPGLFPHIQLPIVARNAK